MSRYQEMYEESCADPEGFWLKTAGMIDWDVPPTSGLDNQQPFPRWFPDGRVNVCRNALDRHVDAGHGHRVALIHDSPVTGSVTELTYAELLDQVARVAGVLRELDVSPGDRVIIYMPMIPEAVVAMLACARIGAVHSVVFGGFAPKELAMRIDDAGADVVVTASCGIKRSHVIAYRPLIDEACQLAEHPPTHCVVLQRPQSPADLGERDLDFAASLAAAPPVDPVPVPSTNPLYVLYTSGTTGRPKGVVRDAGYAVALAWSMRHVFDVGPGETMFTASDIGWVVGHSYIVYGPLLAGATTVIYEGKPALLTHLWVPGRS